MTYESLIRRLYGAAALTESNNLTNLLVEAARAIEDLERDYAAAYERMEPEIPFGYSDEEAREHSDEEIERYVRTGRWKERKTMKYRPEILAAGESTWSNNAVECDTYEEAAESAYRTFFNWFSAVTWRVVTTDTPKRQVYVPGSEDENAPRR